MVQNNSQKREVGIDLLRALSVALVVFSHYGLLPEWFPIGGYHGVVVFFAVSGYCMAMTARGRTFGAFAMARYRRLLPAFVACALLTFIVEAIGPEVLPERGQGLQHLAMTLVCVPLFDIPCEAIYWLGRHFDAYWEYAFVDGAYWSLLVEFRFYIVFAIMYFGLQRVWPAAHGYIWVALLFLSLIAFNQPGFGQGRAQDFAQYLPFFAFGMGVYQWTRGDRTGPIAVGASAFIIGIFCLSQIASVSVPYNPQQILPYGALLLLVALTARPDFTLPAAVAPLVLFVAAASYPLYLIHQDIGLMFIKIAGGESWARVIAIALSLALASAVHFGVEVRLVRWLNDRHSRSTLPVLSAK